MEGVELRSDVRPPSGSVPWPFDRVRDGQSDFLQDARKTLAGGKHLLAHAPTGIGKTAVALVAALDYALNTDQLVLFLTSRQSHHRIAIETVRRIEAKGPRIPTIDLIAKHSMCLQEGAPSHGRAFQEFCDFKVKSRTCGFFTRDNSAVVAAVLQRTLHVQELVRASGSPARMNSWTWSRRDSAGRGARPAATPRSSRPWPSPGRTRSGAVSRRTFLRSRNSSCDGGIRTRASCGSSFPGRTGSSPSGCWTRASSAGPCSTASTRAS